MKVPRVAVDDSRLLDPSSSEWRDLSPATFTLDPTPVTAQPSLYIQAKWKQDDYGATKEVAVRAVHNGEKIYFHLSWADDSKNDAIQDTDQFGDAAAVLFPVKGDAPLQSMGSPNQPVNAWYWRADLESPFNITAQGTGTTSRGVDGELGASGSHGAAEWAVVLRRALGAGPDDAHISLTAGQSGKVAFAVWQGANHERGGLKAVTLEWVPLEIEA